MTAKTGRHGRIIGITEAEARLIRLAGHAIGFISLAAFVFLAFRDGPPESFSQLHWEKQIQLGVLTTIVVGYLLAWLWEWVGGGILVFGGVALGVFAAIAYEPREAVFSALAFVVPGALYLLHWQRHAGLVHIVGLFVGLAGLMAVGGYLANQVYADAVGPTHPQSDRPKLPVDLVEWIWAGNVTEAGFSVRALADDPLESPALLVSESADMANAQRIQPAAIGDKNYPLLSFEVSGLDADTEYHYAVADGDHTDTTRQGSLETFPSGAASFTLAFASCARTGSNGEVFETIIRHSPLVFLEIGDFHYENIDQNKIGLFRDAFATQLTKSAQQAMYLSTPVGYVWDDHDFAGDNTDRTAKSREAALAAYRENVPHYPFGVDGDEAPLGQAFTIGRVRFIMTDHRSERDPAGGEGPRSMLGREQLEWFKTELLAASEEYPLVVWVNGVPWINVADPAADNWGGFAEERQEIADFLHDNGVDDKLLILSGDAHMLAIDDGSNSSYVEGDPTGPVVFQAAALDRRGSVRGGPYSEETFPGGGHFGLIDIEDNGGDTITVRLSGRDYLDEELVGLTFTVPADAVAAR